jgi:anti-anti-sigma factor
MPITWDGELDLASSHDLNSELLAAEPSASGRVVLDLRRATFIDSSGLRAILTAHEQLESRGASLHVVKPPPRVFDLFRLTGVDRVLSCVDPPLLQGEAA